MNIVFEQDQDGNYSIVLKGLTITQVNALRWGLSNYTGGQWVLKTLSDAVEDAVQRFFGDYR
jgi:hypothetical protein